MSQNLGINRSFDATNDNTTVLPFNLGKLWFTDLELNYFGI